MEFSEFSDALGLWLEQKSSVSLDCWIDEAQARLVFLGDGVRCSLEVLDTLDSMSEPCIEEWLHGSAAGVACGCKGALAIDPESHGLVLVEWCRAPCDSSTLLASLESLANQRATLLSLMNTSVASVPDVSALADPDRLFSGV